jgi:type III restriction enzyme
VDYLKPSGAIGFYSPDWVVVQKTEDGEVNWIVETKGRVWEGTEEKDKAMHAWCERVTQATGTTWRYLRVNQSEFEPAQPRTFDEVVKMCAS